mmetsp:Transcript_18149/g.54811  ORF Transcript_18149/g.54811 Transcript_18149/m.54811 type:complete len:109 (-) Transcript_18149:316-642(-)
MRAALWMVARRCATTSVVRLAVSSPRARWTSHSLAASRLEVASSSNSTVGSRTSARAMARRCFCPPLSMTPRSPTSARYLSGKAAMKSCALAALAAASTSRPEEPSKP